MEKKTAQGLTIGPATEKLLQALRALETAKEYYYIALEHRGGEAEATRQLESTAPAWDAVAGIIEGELNGGLRLWAAELDTTEI